MNRFPMERARRWSKYIRSVRFLPTRLLRFIARPTRPTAKPGPISALPPELLHAVFKNLEFSDHPILWSCMRVCRHWYDIARPHFFAIVPVRYHHRKQFTQYLSAHPELAKNVKTVRFYDKSWGKSGNNRRLKVSPEPFDIELLASTLPILTNLQILSLVGFENRADPSSPSQYRAQRGSSIAPSLKRLSLNDCSGIAFMLFDVLSLFSAIDTLAMCINSANAQHRTEISLRNRPSSMAPASIALRDLVVVGNVLINMTNYYAFFEQLLAPGSLRALTIKSYDQNELLTFSRLLRSSVAQDLTSISVDMAYGDYLTSFLFFNAQGVIHVQTVFEHLGAALAQCPRLQDVLIGFVHTDSGCGDPIACPRTFTHVLTNLPATLRAFTIRVQVLAWRSWEQFCRGAAALHAVDCLLAPAAADSEGQQWRFPDLAKVELRVIEDVRLTVAWPPGGKPGEVYDPTLLPTQTLRDAGLFKFVHEVDDLRAQIPVLVIT